MMMPKTPDEIKKGLECDPLALIRQLYADNCRLKDELYNAYNVQNEQLVRINQLEAERDAYREGLKTEVGCYGCKHYVDDPDYDSNECMSCGKNMCNFEWRGVQKEE